MVITPLYSSLTSTTVFYPSMTTRTSRLPSSTWDETRPQCDSQHGTSQEEVAPLFLPRLDRLYKSNFRGEDTSSVTIPVQKTITHQILNR